MDANNFKLKNRFVFILKSPVLTIENNERTISPFIKASELPEELNDWIGISKHVVFGEKDSSQPVEILKTQLGVSDGRKIMFIFDEEGKFKNDKGISLMLSKDGDIYDYIVGNILVMVFDENLHKELMDFGIDGIDGMNSDEMDYFHSIVEKSFVNTRRINRGLTEGNEICCNVVDINKK